MHENGTEFADIQKARTKNQLNIIITGICIFLLFLTNIKGIFLASLLPLKEFNAMRGFFGSPFVGLRNFVILFNGQFARILLNSILYSLLAYCIAALIGGMLANIVAKIENAKVESITALTFQFILVIPIIIISYIFIPQNGMGDGRIGLVIVMIIKSMPIAFLFCYIALKNNYSLGLGVGVFLLICFPFMLSINNEYGVLFLNSPLNRENIDLTKYTYEIMLMQMQVGMGAAIEFIVILWKMISFIVVVPILYNLLKGKKFDLGNRYLTKKDNIISAILIVIAIVFLTICTIVFFNGILDFSQMLILFFVYGINTFLFCIITAIFVTPLVLGSPRSNKIYIFFLLVFYIFNHNRLSSYFELRSMGMINTYFASIIHNIFNVPFIIILGLIINNGYNYGDGFKKLVMTAYKPFLALAVLQMCTEWGGFFYPLITNMDPRLFPPSLLLFSGIMNKGNIQLLPLLLILIMVPLFIFLVFRKCFLYYTENK